jgi:hypothetical protein
MTDHGDRFRAFYGATVWHLLILVAAFALAGWVALRLAGEATAVRILVWFVGAVIAHDLVLFPIYATIDRALRGGAEGRPSLLSHVRVPALASGLLFLVYLPGILKQGQATYAAATGQDQGPYLGRWLPITAVLFLVSGLWYAAKVIRRRHS